MRTSCFIMFLFSALMGNVKAGFITGIDGDLSIYTAYPSSFNRSWTIRYSVTYSQFGTNPLPVVTLPTAFPDQTLTLTGNVYGAVYYSNNGQQQPPDGGVMFKTNQAVGYNCIVSCEPQRHPTVSATDNQAAHGAGNEAGMTLETVVTPIYVTYSTNNPPPEPYNCYFDLQGVYYSEDSSSYVNVDLWVVVPEAILVNLASYSITNNGAYLKSYGPYKLPKELASSYSHYWMIETFGGALGHESYRIDGPAMSGDNPDKYHYISEMDFTIFNTNAPYIPEIPTNMPPQYPEYPGPWDTNTYGPCPPDYSPWPPPYPPPPPLTEWPAYPPPHWPYSTNSPYAPDTPPEPTPDPNSPTNYDDYADSTNSYSYSLSQWYSMFRRVLKDAGNESDYAVPAQYHVTWTNTIGNALELSAQFINEGNITVTATYGLVRTVADKLGAISVTLPDSFEEVTEINLGEIGIFGEVNIDFNPYMSQINLFRNILKFGIYFLSVLYAFWLIRNGLSRGGN